MFFKKKLHINIILVIIELVINKTKGDFMSNQTHTVFVYGTLKKDYGNHSIISKAPYIGEAITDESNFKMISFSGAFPGVGCRPEYKCRVSGEVYEVTDAELYQMDQLESNGRFYQRNYIDVHVKLPNGKYVKDKAWMYLLIDHQGRFELQNNGDIFTDSIDGFHQVQTWRRI
tara:strand:- start:329 stop:847 length:519 start_codon:yes stop_codon:yes gene_type:complete